MHKRDWEVRRTSIGLRSFPWRRTKFLWFQIDHRVVNKDCKILILEGSLGSFCLTQNSTHCWIDRLKESEVLISKFDPCHRAQAKWHFKKRWLRDSSSSLHKRHLLDTWLCWLEPQRLANDHEVISKWNWGLWGEV